MRPARRHYLDRRAAKRKRRPIGRRQLRLKDSLSRFEPILSFSAEAKIVLRRIVQVVDAVEELQREFNYAVPHKRSYKDKTQQSVGRAANMILALLPTGNLLPALIDESSQLGL